MADEVWLKLVELARRELSAQDAHIEIGGSGPESPAHLSTPLSDTRRLVVKFEEAPADSADVELRLKNLAEAFALTGSKTDSESPDPSQALLYSDLREALETLTIRCGAQSAFVIDARSPVVWSHSSRIPHSDVNAMLDIRRAERLALKAGLNVTDLIHESTEESRQDVIDARLQPKERSALRNTVANLHELSEKHSDDELRCLLNGARAVAAVRSLTSRQGSSHSINDLWRGPEVFGLVRSFAVLYQLVVVFKGGFSPLHAKAAVHRSLPQIERLVLSLPPLDPGPKGAKVLLFPCA